MKKNSIDYDKITRSRKKWFFQAAFLIVVLLVAVLFLMSLSPRSKELVRQQEPPAWKGEHVTVDLWKCLERNYGQRLEGSYGMYFEFAKNSEPYILVFFENMRVWDKTRSDKYMVLDFDGNPIDALKRDGELKEPYQYLFPNLYTLPKLRDLAEKARYSFYSDDLDCAIVVREKVKGGIEVLVECYELNSLRLKWKKKFPNSIFSGSFAIKIYGNRYILVVFFDKAFLLSIDNGHVVNTFDFDTIYLKEINKYKHKNDFDARAIDYSNIFQAIACGDFHSRRVRIYSIDSPYTLLCSLNSNDDPHQPPRGSWNTDKVAFADNGRYLTVNYRFDGKYVNHDYICAPTEIYDTKTWKICWYENENSIHSVALSPNGKKLAFLRGPGGKILEIGDFHPQDMMGIISEDVVLYQPENIQTNGSGN